VQPSDPLVEAANPFASRGQFRALFRWFRPYLRGSGRLLTFTVIFTIIVLACQAVIPLQVDSILSGEVSPRTGILILIGLALLQLVSAYFSRLGGADVANDATYRLRLDVFRQLLHTKILRQDGLVRSSVVSRHTTDVDHVGEAFSETIGHGIPGIVRVVQSLILLTVIDWRAGSVMIVAVLLFLLIRAKVGKQLFIKDRARLDASSRVGESVDEAITASRFISGLHLDRWAMDRFGRRSEHLRQTTHAQVNKVSQLYVGAQAAGLAGLVAVVLFGVVLGGSDLATIAVAILYVEGVIRGLEVLPRWIQSLQIGVVSRRRINQVLDPQPSLLLGSVSDSGIHVSLDRLEGAGGQLIGLVTSPSMDPDSILVALSADSDADAYRVTLEGMSIRRPGVNRHIVHVAAENVAFNESIFAHLNAMAPLLSLDDVSALMDDVGLSHLKDSRFGLDKPLGPTGAVLNSNERQRLAIACALAAAPETLLVGPLIPLADVDTAMPLLATLRRHPKTTSIVSVRNPELAVQMDSILFVTDTELIYGNHEELLLVNSEYSRLWEKRLNAGDVDLSFLELDGVSESALAARLVTERFEAGDAIYRQGEPADRIVFIMSGRVEIMTETDGADRRRVAVIGQGNHCGDLRLTPGERRAESAYAMDTCIIRSLSREALSAGMAGLLDRSPTQRRVVTCLLRDGSATAQEVCERLPDLGEAAITAALTELHDEGALRLREGIYSVVMRKSAKKGSADLLDRLSGL
jgi:ATP-binding cassette subfamily B protein